MQPNSYVRVFFYRQSEVSRETQRIACRHGVTFCTVRHSCCDGTNSTQTTHSLWHGRHAGEVTLAPVCGPTWQHDSKFLTYYCQILPAMLDVTPKSFSFLIASDVSLPVCSLTPLFLATCATLFFCRCHPLSAFSILQFSLLQQF